MFSVSARHRLVVLGCLASGFASSIPAQSLTATATDTIVMVKPAVFDHARQRPVMARPIAFSLSPTQTHDLVTWNGEDWVPIQPPIVLPQPVQDMAYDTLHDRILVLGDWDLRSVHGTDVGILPPVPLVSYPVPENRRLVHDAARDEIVVFGGGHFQGVTRIYDDITFVLRAGIWQQATVTVRPPGREYHALVYDHARQRAVLFGGNDGIGGNLADTWEWDGVGWTQLPISGPAAGAAAGTYDEVAQRVVVRDNAGDVWACDGISWTLLGPGTGARWPAALPVFDGATLLLVGGVSQGRFQVETWRLSGAAWQLVPASVHMTPDYSASMVYDTVRGELLCVTGNWAIPTDPTSTWSWNGSWRRHPAATPAMGVLAFDSARGEGVLFTGVNPGATWTWNGTSWIQRTPAHAPTFGANPYATPMIYDPIRQVTLLAGVGTWLWDGSDWNADPGPQPTRYGLCAFDAGRSAVVMTFPNGSAAETWEWTGQWSQQSATGPPAALATFDPVRNRVVAFDSLSEYEWTGSAWIGQPHNLPMQLQYVHDMATDFGRGRIVFRGTIGPDGSTRLYVLGPTPSLVVDLGGGCVPGMPLTVEERPGMGRTPVLASTIAPGGVAIFGMSLQPVSIPVGGCELKTDGSLAVIWRFAGGGGRADLPLPIAATAALRGMTAVVQAVTLEANQWVLSRALELRIGD